MALFWIAWLVLTIVAAGGGGVAHVLGRLVIGDLLVIYIVCVLASELGLLAITLLKGSDQAAAAQAGLSGMTVLMLVAFGGILVARFTGLIRSGESLMVWSSLLFFVSLALVAAGAIKTIRRAPLAGPKSTPGAQS